MTAFVSHRRRGANLTAEQFENCANGCVTANGLKLEALFVVTFLDSYDVPLCVGCRDVWRDAWESARIDHEEAA